MSNSPNPNRSCSASDYKNAEELFASIKDAFEKSNAPLGVSFSTLDAVETFAAYVLSKDEIQAQPESDYVGYPYACKPLQVSMFYLNRICSEIKALPDSFLPISFCFQSFEEVKRFAIDYMKSIPLSQLKNFINLAETRKPREPEKDNSKLIRWCLIGGGIIVLAAIIFLLIPKKTQTIKVEVIDGEEEQKLNTSLRWEGFDLSKVYTALEYKQIMSAINQGGDRTITISEFESLPKPLQEKMISSGDVNVFAPLKREYGNGSYSSTRQTTSSQSGDYSWIVGNWYVTTPYGTMSVQFRGNGKKGRCTFLEDATNAYGAKHGDYYVEGDTLYMELEGESYRTTIEIQSGNRLHAGGGYYYKKIQ